MKEPLVPDCSVMPESVLTLEFVQACVQAAPTTVTGDEADHEIDRNGPREQEPADGEHLKGRFANGRDRIDRLGSQRNVLEQGRDQE